MQKNELLLSHPEKELYPGEGITKLDIARYYMTVAVRLREYLYHRHLAMLRCPEGISAECFFQKHIGGNVFPQHIKQSQGHLYVEDIRGILEMVQMGGFEIHAGNATADTPEQPDQFVLDLDPGADVAWKTVVLSALKIRAELKRLGLHSFVKLSGGKGLHIHVPFRRGPDWEEVKNFTQSLAVALELKYPNIYVSQSGARHRHGKIFLDYLRNSAKATSVMPYSLRARPGAAVAWPISWERLRKTASSDTVNIFSTPDLLRRTRDPWKGFFQRPPGLPQLSLLQSQLCPSGRRDSCI